MSIIEKSLRLSPFAPTKILCHLDRLSRGTDLGPITISIDITNTCNHNCLWCNSSKYQLEKPGSMDFEMFRVLVVSLSRLKTNAISITGGGEPTCHPLLNEMLECAFDAGLEVSMVSNGSWLDRINPELLNRLRYLRISLDAGSETTHNLLHRPLMEDSGWNRIIKNLEHICMSKPPEFIVGIGYLVHWQNVSEVPALARVLRDLKADYFQLRPVKHQGENVECETVAKAYRAAKRMETATFKVYEVGTKYLPEVNPAKKCRLLPLVCNISPQGDVYPCCELRGRSEYAYGCLINQTFEEIWWSRERYHVMKNILPENCLKCKYSLMNVLIEKVVAGDLLHINFL